MSELISIFSIIFYILAAIFMIIAIVLFVTLKIPAVWGELSGHTARKSIALTRKENEKRTAKFEPTVQRDFVLKKENVNKEVANTTETLDEDTEETVALMSDDCETVLLDGGEGDTEKISNGFTMLEDVVVVHTKEAI